MSVSESLIDPIHSQTRAVILSLCYSDEKLGAAVYEQSSATIKILYDTKESDEYNVISSLFHELQPTTVLVCKSQDLNYVRFISEKCTCNSEPQEIEQPEPSSQDSHFETCYNENGPSAEGDSLYNGEEDGNDKDENEDEDDDDPFKACTLHFLPSNLFRIESSKTRIAELFSSDSFSRSETELMVNFRIDAAATNMLRAFGALLKYLDAARIGVEFETLNVRTPVKSVKKFTVNHMVEIDWATYRALEIFGEDKKKEGGWKKAITSGEATLFSVMNRCRSTPGKHTLMRWFEHPTLDFEVLKMRQKAISYFVQDCNMDVTSMIHHYLRQIRNVKYILKRMSAATTKVRHWKSFSDTVLNLIAIGRCLSEKNIRLAILDEYTQFFGSKLAEIATVISHIIDFQESEAESRLVVNRNVDPDLDESKHIYDNLPKILSRVAEEESERLGISCSVGYVPMVGYLLALPIDFDVNSVSDLNIIYCTEDRIHVKSDKMNYLDEELGDIKMQIIDKETTISLRLQNLVVDNGFVVIGGVRGAAVLDAIISMALSARYFGWHCPILVSEPVLEATNSVHPLAKIVAKDKCFIPNPISFGKGHSKIKIIMGPNACGKSVYMKQVAILAFLAHIGSFVPAERSIVGPVNRILTRVYTVDSALDGMSTFARDLSQLAVALRRANQFSLVIIDEFGKGTLTEVGMSLLTAALRYWIGQGDAVCPHVLVSSHFHALTQYIKESEMVSYQSFEVTRHGSRLDFQFRLVRGVVNCSHAAYTAFQMGISPEVIERANEIYMLLKKGRDLTELKFKQNGQNMYDFLWGQMDDLFPEFVEWDLDHDLDGFLDRVEKLLLDESEQTAEDDIDSAVSQLSQTNLADEQIVEENNESPAQQNDESPTQDSLQEEVKNSQSYNLI